MYVDLLFTVHVIVLGVLSTHEVVRCSISSSANDNMSRCRASASTHPNAMHIHRIMACRGSPALIPADAVDLEEEELWLLTGTTAYLRCP